MYGIMSDQERSSTMTADPPTQEKSDFKKLGSAGGVSTRSRVTTGRVLFLIDEMASITAGGTERQLLQMVSIAQRIGFLPQICVLRNTSWLTEEIAGCPVKLCGLERIRSRAGLRRLREIISWMRQEQVEILQTFFVESHMLGPWLAKAAGVPVVIGMRRNTNQLEDFGQRVSPYMLMGQWISNLLVDHILCNSHAVCERIVDTERAPAAKMRVIYNGIDTQAVKPLPGMRTRMRAELGLAPSDLLVGNVSGLRWIKGVDIFVEAAAIAYAANPALRFVIVGDGKVWDEIEKLIRARNLSAVVKMVGAIEDVRPYLAAMDIAVLSSRAEGFSNSILEYMVAGLPTIATDVGGNREALDGAGILVPADDAAELAHAIGLLQDAEERERYGRAAQRAVARFDLTVAEDNIRDFYEEQLQKKSRVRR
jgi:glycosyltransferase involved in cell wall biosynthesis